MKNLAFIIGVVSLAVACNAIEEPSNIEKDKAQAVEQVTNAPILKASIDEAAEPETKSYLNEADWHILWTANDEISAFVKTTSNWKYKFSGATGAQYGDFGPVDGYTPAGGSTITNVYAVYPYNASNSIDANGVLTVNFPATQSYKAKSFGQGANTMVAVSPSSESNLSFKNACGYLMLKLYGNNVNVKTVSFKGRNNEAIAGAATISIQPGQDPSVTMASNATSEVVLDCGSGVTIGNSSTNYTEFWFALPPVTLSGFTITVTTTDGRVFTRSNTSSFEVVRGQGKKMAPLEVVPVTPTPTNLSANGTANTYIVNTDNINADGYYFNATKAGNGETNTNTYFNNLGLPASYVYPASGDISGAGVKSIWIENNCITDLAYDSANKTITFKATGVKGNAKVTLTEGVNGTGNGVWTWLIWCTDVPQTVAYHNETNGFIFDFTVLDRNLGATTAQPSTDLHAQNGLYYQFGNPIPFTKAEFANCDANPYRMSDALALNPHKPFANSDFFWFSPWGSTDYARQIFGLLWGGWSTALLSSWGNYLVKPMNQIPKTKYDPCPVGYQVAPYSFFWDLALSETYANGLGRYVSGTGNQLYFPCNGCVDSNPNGVPGSLLWDADEPNYYIFLWTLNHENSNSSYYFLGGRGGNPDIKTEMVGRGMGVRCVAEN